MNNQPEDREKLLDNQLAEYIDRVLADERHAQMLPEQPSAELASLQKNALRLKAAADQAKPSAASMARVRARLLKSWKRNGQTRNWLQKLFETSVARPSARLALVGGLALLFIFGVFALQLISNTGPLMGTADADELWAPVFILAGVVLILLIFWLDRHN